MFPTADSADISQVTSHKSKSSPFRDARDSPESPQTNRLHKDLTLNMLIKELIFCLALALTTYGALHNTTAKVSKHPTPVKFFHAESYVRDWYKGQLSHAMAYVNKAEISFVMFYAPWDAECQHVRGQFNRAAKILGDRVHFSAINCWNPGSECRLQHSKIGAWPILMAYTSTSRGVLYKGPRDAHYMVKFLELLMKPLERISSTEDLVNLLSVCDAIAVGFTPISSTSRYYNVWYNMALKLREYDSVGEICVAVVTSEELSFDLGVESVPSARLMLWNGTKDFIFEDTEISNWNESSLLSWVLENFVQPVARIIPMWKKAFSFERYADGNPMLILFTPLNPLYEQLPNYALLREVAMEYYNCNNNETSQWITELIKLQQVHRLLYQRKDFKKSCKKYKFKKIKTKPNHFNKEIVSQNNKYPWNNITQKSQRNGFFDFILKRGLAISKVLESVNENPQLFSTLGLLDECSNILPAEKGFYDGFGQCNSMEEEAKYDDSSEEVVEDIETTMLPLEDDHLSSENLIEDSVKHFCKLFLFAQEWGPPVAPGRVNNGNMAHVRGLACDKNFTLNILAVDSVRNHHFAEALGVDIVNIKDKTAAVLLDSKHETQYVLKEDFNAKSIREFISNFTYNRLERFLRTRVDSDHTHHFGSNGTPAQVDISNSTVQIIDLTTRTFSRVVNTPNVVSLVAVCGGGCGGAVVRALVEAVALLRQCGVPARAARLDALRHDLPWHYTVHHYPTLLVFGTTRRNEAEWESRSYPAGARITSSGLVSLALRALGAPHYARVRLALCAKVRAQLEKKTCMKEFREHITKIIGRNLKYWRRTEDSRLKEAFFRRLQHLHTVSLALDLLHITDLNTNSRKQNLLIKALSELSKVWDIDVRVLRKNVIPSGIS